MWARIVSSVFGIGRFPVFPGTMGSLFALALSLPLALIKCPCSWTLPAALLVVSVAAGLPAVNRVLRTSENRDPKWVVVDETAGQSLALLMSPVSWEWYMAAFVLFRLFDILKPFPICRLERLKGEWGVFADDLAAGAVSGAILMIASRAL